MGICMGCKDCDNDPNRYPYRYGDATIEIIACDEHAQRVIDELPTEPSPNQLWD